MNFLSFLRQSLSASLVSGYGPIQRTYKLKSSFLGRHVELDVYRPAVFPHQSLRLVVFNDGQDLRRMDTQAQLAYLMNEREIPPTLVVGLIAGDRMREYGTSERPDYKGRGDLARAQEQFVIEELLPWLNRRYLIYSKPRYRAIAGFSLGGLNAFDLAWRNPEVFGGVGVFSGALWWRSTPFDPKDPDGNRIVHTYVDEAKEAPAGMRVWLMAGTEDEKEDRNNNGVIDAIDDTLDLKSLLESKGLAAPEAVSYFEVQGGQHNPDTWKTVVPVFLHWILRK